MYGEAAKLLFQTCATEKVDLERCSDDVGLLQRSAQLSEAYTKMLQNKISVCRAVFFRIQRSYLSFNGLLSETSRQSFQFFSHGSMWTSMP